MRCIELRKLVDAYVDNETTEEQNKLLTMHAESCSECHALIEEAFHLDAQMRSLDADEPRSCLNAFGSPLRPQAVLWEHARRSHL
jgi:hypothetical protein